MGPSDYSAGVLTPFQAGMQGYAAGAAIRDDQANQAALQAQQAQRVQQQQMLQSLINNKNAGAKEYADATLLMPQLKDNFKQAWDMKSTAQQESGLRDMGQYYAAVQSGRPDIAAQQMKSRADAMEASGASPQEVAALRAQAQVVDAHPEFARATLGMLMASVPGGDKMLTSASTMGTEQRAQDKAPAELQKAKAEAGIKGAEAAVAPQKLDADIAATRAQTQNLADRLGLDRDKLMTETQLKVQEMRAKAGEVPEPVIKNINDATTEAISAQQSATKMTQLADQLAKEGGGYGSLSTAAEWMKRATGNQNEMTRLRSEYNRIVTPAAMAAYKQNASGSTSDKDIETAMTGVPKDNADAATMASFLRGAAKLQMYSSVLNNAKSEWFAANKHLGKISKDAEIDGVKVPAGTSFKQFADDYVGQKMGQVQGVSVLNSLAAKYGAPQNGGATGGY